MMTTAGTFSLVVFVSMCALRN